MLKKLLISPYFQVIIGIILTVLFIQEKSIFGIIAILGVLLIVVSFIRILDQLNGEETNVKNLIFGSIIIPALFVSFITIVGIEFKHLGKIINQSQFLKTFGSIGVLCALGIIALIYFFRSKINRKLSTGVMIVSMFAIPLLIISLFSFINRYKLPLESTERTCIVNYKEYQIDTEDSSESQYWIYTTVETYNEKIDINEELWNNLEEKDTIILTIKDGNLGFQIVHSLIKK